MPLRLYTNGARKGRGRKMELTIYHKQILNKDVRAASRRLPHIRTTSIARIVKEDDGVDSVRELNVVGKANCSSERAKKWKAEIEQSRTPTVRVWPPPPPRYQSLRLGQSQTHLSFASQPSTKLRGSLETVFTMSLMYGKEKDAEYEIGELLLPARGVPC